MRILIHGDVYMNGHRIHCGREGGRGGHVKVLVKGWFFSGPPPYPMRKGITLARDEYVLEAGASGP